MSGDKLESIREEKRQERQSPYSKSRLELLTNNWNHAICVRSCQGYRSWSIFHPFWNKNWSEKMSQLRVRASSIRTLYSTYDTLLPANGMLLVIPNTNASSIFIYSLLFLLFFHPPTTTRRGEKRRKSCRLEGTLRVRCVRESSGRIERGHASAHTQTTHTRGVVVKGGWCGDKREWGEDESFRNEWSKRDGWKGK
jgi:hypothetical protein